MGKACKTGTQFYTFFFFSLQWRPGWRIWFFHSMPLAWGEILIFPLSLLHAHLLNQFAPDLMLWHVGRCTRLTVTDDGSGHCPLHVTAGSGWPASRPRLLLGRTQSRAQYTLSLPYSPPHARHCSLSQGAPWWRQTGQRTSQTSHATCLGSDF